MAERHATIIYNPMSGRRGRRAENARALIGRLGERGIAACALPTAGPDDATRIAREAIASESDIIISYGGDGTLNEVLQGMVGSRARLAVWPGGTSNVIARDLGISSRIEQIADMVTAGKTKRIALGVIKTGAKSESEGPAYRERYFLMMAGIGLDASIARGVNKKLKRKTGEFAYWVTGVKHLVAWKPETFIIEIDGTPYESVFAVVGNGKGYGGGMCMTPGARLEEPWFEVYIVPRLRNNLSYLRVLGACLRGKPETTRAKIVRGRHIKANSTNQPWVEADGEVIGPLPMTIDIVPDALSVIVP